MELFLTGWVHQKGNEIITVLMFIRAVPILRTKVLQLYIIICWSLCTERNEGILGALLTAAAGSGHGAE